MLQVPKSPLFPDTSLTAGEESCIPQLPDTPTIQTSSLQIYIVPTEKHLFVQGFKPSEYELRPPTLLRGCLVMRVLKPCKLKSVSLTFRGIQKTDWPEGIPPKRNAYAEVNDLVNHSWPFYNQDTPVPNFGADMYVGKKEELALELQVSPLNMPDNSLLFMSLWVKRASTLAVPSPGAALSPVSSFHDLSAVLSGLSQSDLSKAACAMPGDYVYNFEHPIPALSPESTQVNFGVVHYYLEASVSRQTTFKSNLCGRIPIKVVRVPSDNSVEENEPIVIERDWEDQLRYEIIVGSKSVVLDSFLPLSLKFIPLYGKVALHRIRIYITEDCNYYCNGKSVHRTEPSRKYLLLEHKAEKNMSILSKNGGQGPDADDEILPRELEFQMFVPTMVNKKHTYSIHADTAVDNIQVTHWIKISLRISRQDTENPDKRKHFEILIDLPIHLHSPLAAHNLTLLPKYNIEPEYLPQYSQTPICSPGVTPVDANVFPVGSEIPRPSTPIEFQHINSPSSNNDPIERDDVIHLESNLYKPEHLATLDAIGSPQATALTPVASPLASPLRNTSQPSRDPPSFDTLGITLDTLPPAYEKESLSLSPLRLDSPLQPLGIKNKLSKQLDNFEHSHTSRSRGSSDNSERSKLTLNSKHLKESERSSVYLKEGTSKDERVNESLENNESNNSSNPELPESSEKNPNDSGLPEKLGNNISRNSLNTRESGRSGSVSRRLSMSQQSLDEQNATDLADFALPEQNFSRNSSITLSVFQSSLDDMPLEQTIPLLTFSSASINEDGLNIGRSGITDSMTDLVPTSFEGFSIRNSLHNIANPRLTKHYQDEQRSEFYAGAKSRQKSFGVVPDTPQEAKLGPESDDSGSTIDEITGDVNFTPNEFQPVLSR